jgi:AmmeMemoRadiSam system protein B
MKLPSLRFDLDFTPTPDGLLIRDPFRYSDAMLLIPPMLVEGVALFDGEHTDLDLREFLVRLTGELEVSELQEHLTGTLASAGFLNDETYGGMKQARLREFAAAGERTPAHAGSAYPAEPLSLRETFLEYMNGAVNTGDGNLIGIAAPHVSPHGGVECYRAAYALLSPEEYADRTFVILGTSHYGQAERFGLTRKDFTTPYGRARSDTRLVDRLAGAAPESVLLEDYCHAVEHSIEFQIVFLQHIFGPDIRILPVLCGAFARSVYGNGMPEDDEGVRRFFGALGEMAASEGNRLLWVLGIDMAHMGRRYNDPFSARANQGYMSEVAERDATRIAAISRGDAAAFWDDVRQAQDDLKWCGSAPLYTFMKAVPQARGDLRLYQQWNIDEDSVVSFAGIGFTA